MPDIQCWGSQVHPQPTISPTYGVSGGDAPKHGGDKHNDAIDNSVKDLRNDQSVKNIRKNQEQVDVNGNSVGKNRPDIQYDKDGKHHVEEYDTRQSNGQKHGKVINKNDPNAVVKLNGV